MRNCAKIGCGAEAFATISLRYEDREVLVNSLAPLQDPNLLELCREHTRRMTPPVGWTVTDERAEQPAEVS